MARKYSRDNRGRFASAGGGATARGGRLKTAAGNKRKTQTAIIRSAGSKQAGKDLLKASQKSFKVNAPTRFGGENQGYATPRGKAADQGRVAAFRNLKAAQRKGGLPASGGAMRVKGGIKRDPGAAAKLASRAKPARAAAKPKTGQEVMKANVRKVQNQKLRKINAQIKEAGPNAAGLRLQKLQLQSNMTSTRPKRTPRQEAKEQASVAAAKGRVATMRRVNRARANKDRTADTRNIPGSAMKRRPSQKTTRANNLADRALSFYSNPAKALQAVKKSRRGFRLPRGMR
jgi:hypothetical protein